MTVNSDDQTVERQEALMRDVVEESDLSAIDSVLGLGDPQRVGRFRFYLDGHRWEWSDAVARMHGYKPGEVQPTTELLLQHKHPEDRERVAAVLERVMKGKPFSSRHRIIDTAGRTHCVVVAGDRMVDDAGAPAGTSGFYVDVTDSLHTDITNVLSAVADARARIEQAKGVLMIAYGISAERAFDILVWRSQESNLKVRDVAARFLDAVASKASPETQSQVDQALLTLE
ncbi:PAS and ANTAR domain-containing protein [Mycobacterium sp. WUMAC-067]|uniref:PAS and ANTAR domain-containing protein n=1 Tax=unclassified Mycobacterium TaxID=2642494 RepID=UPI001CDA4540|nr:MULTISPECIES: PAS and ANTAR domain-containing protein [unclassified Mycobacterium]MCA2241555.1 PAS and ANTAR domain-containing protein [Mycobacterium sp. WUMAC-067]MCA2314269.1 PAS and ANTAR domain-containing protein [Mycobacterium sp. WUMAC-025]